MSFFMQSIESKIEDIPGLLSEYQECLKLVQDLKGQMSFLIETKGEILKVDHQETEMKKEE